MRAEEAPTPDTVEALAKYISDLVQGPHDYSTCVYAVSLAATATFNFVASKLGVTGFQASRAGLDILRRTRRLEGPSILLKVEDLLYPQYDLVRRLREAVDSWSGWAAQQAAKKLEENKATDGRAYKEVVRH